MRLGKSLATLAMTGAFALASLAGASAQQQPPSPPQKGSQISGGFGPTWLGAVIAADGTHVAGSGGLGLFSSARLSTGNYEVIFRRKRDRCVATGSIGNRAFGSAHGFIDIVHRSGNDSGFFVQTKDTAGVATDLNFILLVYCTT